MRSAIEALTRLATPEATASLISLLADVSRRELCISALAQLGAEQIAVVGRGLSHHHPGVRSAVVVGGGFIGLEMAENLKERGVEVSLVEMLPQVMAPLDFEMAAMLHRELRAHLGNHVVQAGSLVAPDRLRFDFTHDSAIDRETLARIERAVNEAVLANQPVNVAYMGQKEAIAAGAISCSENVEPSTGTRMRVYMVGPSGWWVGGGLELTKS